MALTEPSPSPSPGKPRRRGPAAAVASTATCSPKSAGPRRFDPTASCAGQRHSSKPSVPPSSTWATSPLWSRPNDSDQQETEMSSAPLDGNATAGDFAAIFTFDVTTATTTCTSCRQTHSMATLRAYLHAPGIVLRCASCAAVQIRLVRAPERAWLDMRGVEVLAIHGPSLVTG